MPNSVSLSFRDQTTGKINDLLIDEQRACAQSQNLLSFLAGAIVRHKDEGVEFSPYILLCDSIDRVMNPFVGSVYYKVGEVVLDYQYGSKILKDCVPLTSQNWFIYIERTSDGKASYGVFSYFALPTAIPLHDAISINENEFCILLRKLSSTTIELRGAKGNALNIIFSTVRETASSVGPVDKFVKSCCADLTDQINCKDFEKYFTKLVEKTLSASHGTIMIRLQAKELEVIEELRDAIILIPDLNIFQTFSNYQNEETSSAILNLQRCEDLLQGFVRCDGMIAFDGTGRVIAYRVFYRPTNNTPPIEVVVGGARRRAFEGLKHLTDQKLLSVLFRSQDGLTIYYGEGA